MKPGKDRRIAHRHKKALRRAKRIRSQDELGAKIRTSLEFLDQKHDIVRSGSSNRIDWSYKGSVASRINRVK